MPAPESASTAAPGWRARLATCVCYGAQPLLALTMAAAAMLGGGGRPFLTHWQVRANATAHATVLGMTGGLLAATIVLSLGTRRTDDHHRPVVEDDAVAQQAICCFLVALVACIVAGVLYATLCGYPGDDTPPALLCAFDAIGPCYLLAVLLTFVGLAAKLYSCGHEAAQVCTSYLIEGTILIGAMWVVGDTVALLMLFRFLWSAGVLIVVFAAVQIGARVLSVRMVRRHGALTGMSCGLAVSFAVCLACSGYVNVCLSLEHPQTVPVPILLTLSGLLVFLASAVGCLWGYLRAEGILRFTLSDDLVTPEEPADHGKAAEVTARVRLALGRAPGLAARARRPLP